LFKGAGAPVRPKDDDGLFLKYDHFMNAGHRQTRGPPGALVVNAATDFGQIEPLKSLYSVEMNVRLMEPSFVRRIKRGIRALFRKLQEKRGHAHLPRSGKQLDSPSRILGQSLAKEGAALSVAKAKIRGRHTRMIIRVQANCR
jgi:hypothetical protein